MQWPPIDNTNLCSVTVRIADDDHADVDDDGVDDDDNPIEPRSSTVYLIVPGDFSAMAFTDWFDKTDERIGDCPVRKDTSVDAALNHDYICQKAKSPFHVACNIHKTRTDEYLVYKFKKDPYKHRVDFSFRLASNREYRRIKVIVYSKSGREIASTIIESPSEGRDAYESKSWSNVYLGSGENFELKILFLDSKVRNHLVDC
jgi:hypothetical protein